MPSTKESVNSRKDSVYAQLGVWSLAIVFIILAVVSLMVSNIILTKMLPQQYAYLWLQVWGVLLPYIQYMIEYNGILYPPWSGGILIGFEFLNIIALGGLISAGTGVFAGLGLATMKRRGYYLGLVFGVILVIIGLYPILFIGTVDIIAGSGILYICMLSFIIVGIAAILYLAHKFEEETAKRIPLGVLTLAVFLIIVAVLSLMGSIIVFTRTVPDLKTSESVNLWMAFSIVYRYPDILYGEASPFFGLGFSTNLIPYYELAAWSGLIMAGLGVPSSIGSLMMKNWGRYLGVALGVVLIIFGVYPFFAIFRLGIFFIIFGVITIWYLASEVKYRFESTPEKVERLIKNLKDRDWMIREESARALKMIGGERAVEPLIQVLRDEKWSVRMKAAIALGNIGDERAIKPLFQSLADENKSVRKFVGLSLIKIIKNKMRL